MSIFSFYKDIKLKNKNVIKRISNLLNIYKKLPETNGCMENISKCDGCGGWCCRIQSPQLLYSEFLNIWNFILKTFDIDDIIDILEKSLLNYVEGDINKGCIFLNTENSFCKIYKYRPFNCRTYGIVPKEDFDKNKQKVEKRLKGVLGVSIKDQCNLVKTENGEILTSEKIDKIWKELVNVEENIGIESYLINDNIGGSYRTPHDHILLYVMPEKMQELLVELRKNNKNLAEQKLHIKRYIKNIRDKIYE